MAQRSTRLVETEADRYWRDKTGRSGYSGELVTLALLLAAMFLN